MGQIPIRWTTIYDCACRAQTIFAFKFCLLRWSRMALCRVRIMNVGNWTERPWEMDNVGGASGQKQRKWELTVEEKSSYGGKGVVGISSLNYIVNTHVITRKATQSLDPDACYFYLLMKVNTRLWLEKHWWRYMSCTGPSGVRDSGRSLLKEVYTYMCVYTWRTMQECLR